MSVAATIDQALLLEPESDERDALVSELQDRHDEETYTAALELLRSDDPDRRKLGAEVLSQLGARCNDEDRPFRLPTIDLLLELVETEPDTHVLARILWAFGTLGDARTIAPTVARAAHPDVDVRRGVVFALLGRDDDRAVETLIALTGDADDDVRDKATFGLAQMVERDTPELREALVARLQDPYIEARTEAYVGLALRGDRRAVEPLIADIEDGWEGPNLDEAAELYGLEFG